MKIAVLGGGAAGFFSAISAKIHHPHAEVTLFEKSQKLLSKVKISGGGRCNVTHACFDPKELAGYYPRGGGFLKKAFPQFHAQHTFDWFEERGVKLKTYADGCVFPLANDSQVIIDCFLAEAKKRNIQIEIGSALENISILPSGKINSTFKNEVITYDKMIIAIGGQPKKSNLKWLEDLGLQIIDPVPSLFTFNMPKNPIAELMGNVVEKTSAKIEGTKFQGRGPLLVTHWGMSGPAIITLSAWAARYLEAQKYEFALLVNWLDDQKEDQLKETILHIQKEQGNKMVANANPFPMTNRLWQFLMLKFGVPKEHRWRDVQGKMLNRLINGLLNDRYLVSGKTTFKEEFVTAGGVDLGQIDVKTMQWKDQRNIAFAGEVMDIDGVTGGFNFQSAWTTAWIAGKYIGN